MAGRSCPEESAMRHQGKEQLERSKMIARALVILSMFALSASVAAQPLEWSEFLARLQPLARSGEVLSDQFFTPEGIRKLCAGEQ
jgi:hypothetical protein